MPYHLKARGPASQTDLSIEPLWLRATLRGVRWRFMAVCKRRKPILTQGAQVFRQETRQHGYYMSLLCLSYTGPVTRRSLYRLPPWISRWRDARRYRSDDGLSVDSFRIERFTWPARHGLLQPRCRLQGTLVELVKVILSQLFIKYVCGKGVCTCPSRI